LPEGLKALNLELIKKSGGRKMQNNLQHFSAPHCQGLMLQKTDQRDALNAMSCKENIIELIEGFLADLKPTAL
jgi:hypothetical protein